MTNEITEQNTSPNIITSSDLDGPPELTSSLIDAQPNSADEDWENIPALIPKPLKIEERTNQDQGKHSDNTSANLVDVSQAPEPASHPVPNAFSEEDRDIIDNNIDGWARMLSETKPPQAAWATPSSEEQAEQDQVQSPENVSTNLGDDSQAPELASPFASNPLPEKDQDITDNNIEEWAAILSEKKPLQAPWATQPSAMQVTSRHDADPISGVPSEMNTVPQNQMIDSSAAERQEHIKNQRAEMACLLTHLRLENVAIARQEQIERMNRCKQLEQTDRSTGSENGDSPEQRYATEDADMADSAEEASMTPESDKIDSSEAIADEHTPLEVSRDLDAIVVGVSHLQLDARSGEAVPQETDMGLITTSEESSNDPTNEHDGDHGNKYHQSSIKENTLSEAVGLGEETLPQHHAENIEAAALAKDDSKDFYHSPADNNPSLETSNDEKEVDPNEPHSQPHPEHIEAIAIEKEDSKDDHQSPADKNPSLETSDDEGGGVNVNESHSQHHPQDTEAVALPKNDSNHDHHSTTENPPLATSNDEQEADTEKPHIPHHLETTEAIAAANSYVEKSHEAQINESPAPATHGGEEKTDHEESYRRSTAPSPEPIEGVTTSQAPLATTVRTDTQEVANTRTFTTETGDGNEARNSSYPSPALISTPSPEKPTQKSKPQEAGRAATIAGLQKIDQGTDNAVQTPEKAIASKAVLPAEDSHDPKAGMEVDREQGEPEDEVPGIETRVKKVGWKESLRRFLFFAS